MAKKETKIQPADVADETQAGTTPQGATEELPDLTNEQIAGMKPEEIVAYVGNAKKSIASATKKWQEAADAKRQTEQLKAESKYYKAQAEQMQDNLAKLYEQMSRPPQQPAPSTQSQPPEYDPYNPEKWAQNLHKYYEEKLSTNNSRYDELSKKFEELEKTTDVGIKTLRMEKYLEKAIPEIGPDVSVEEIQIWAAQHPDADYSNMETINQAIRERQAIYDQKMEKKWETYVADKEKAQVGSQDVPGSPYAGSAPDYDKFADMTPAEQDAVVIENMKKALKAQGGGK
jgi:hypothetical protein